MIIKNEENELENGMKRGLDRRHVQMIAIAGTIGTGLFLGSGRAIHLTGPSIILVYLITGIFMYMMMRAIGELLYKDPDQHTFINFITHYLGKGFGFFSGWSYWISLIFIGMADLTAIAKYVQFWFPSWHSWAIQVIAIILLGSVNLIAVNLFGETEYWFSMIKIVAIIALIVTAIFMVIGGFQTDYGQASLSNITTGFSLFPNGWLSFVMAFQMVFFAYQNIEFVGITTSETKNPRKVLPKAIKDIPVRIGVFYIGSLVGIMLIVPWQHLTAASSPFVMVFQLAGLKWAAALINFVVLTSSASALNSVMYSTGRNLYQIANEHPNRLLSSLSINRLSARQVPQAAIVTSIVLVAMGVVIDELPGVSDAFALVAAASSGVTIIIYSLVMWAHARYRRSQDFMSDGFIMPFYRVVTPITLLFFLFVFVSLFLQKATYIGAIGSAIWIVILGSYSFIKYHRKA